MVGSLISLVLASAYVGLLGLLPILIGLKKLYDLRAGSGESEDADTHQDRGGALGRMASVAAVTIAHGGDNIGIYTPLFATQRLAEIGLIVAVFAVMTAVWLAVAHWLVHHRRFGAPIRRYGYLVVPFVLIALGLFILYQAGSFALLSDLVGG